MSDLSLLYSNDGKPSFFSLSKYESSLQDFTSFVALRCTFSMAILSFLYIGNHITAPLGERLQE